MKKIFLIGFYGYGNFGDDLLLKSFLQILNEIKFDGILFLPLENELEFNEKYRFQIIIVSRFNFYELRRTIKDCDVIIFGGGNLFQSETSYRSFMYYYYIAHLGAKFNKTILLLSQGFGSFKEKRSLQKLKKILSYPKLYGNLRDKTSYAFASRCNKNISLGVDVGPYAFLNYTYEKTDKISVCLKEEHDLQHLTEFLSTFENYSLSTLVINANQDALKNYELVENIRKKTNVLAEFPFKDPNKIIKEISESKIIISDRLHSALTGIFFAGQTITFNNIKNRRVLKNIKEDYNFFYKNTSEIPFIYYDTVSSNYDFKEASDIYKDKLQKTIFDIKTLIQSIL